MQVEPGLAYTYAWQDLTPNFPAVRKLICCRCLFERFADEAVAIDVQPGISCLGRVELLGLGRCGWRRRGLIRLDSFSRAA